jgi:hypothetical protein
MFKIMAKHAPTTITRTVAAILSSLVSFTACGDEGLCKALRGEEGEEECKSETAADTSPRIVGCQAVEYLGCRYEPVGCAATVDITMSATGCHAKFATQCLQTASGSCLSSVRAL